MRMKMQKKQRDACEMKSKRDEKKNKQVFIVAHNIIDEIKISKK